MGGGIDNLAVNMVQLISLSDLAGRPGPFLTVMAIDSGGDLLTLFSFFFFCEGNGNDDFMNPFDETAISGVPVGKPGC